MWVTSFCGTENTRCYDWFVFHWIGCPGPGTSQVSGIDIVKKITVLIFTWVTQALADPLINVKRGEEQALTLSKWLYGEADFITTLLEVSGGGGGGRCLISVCPRQIQSNGVAVLSKPTSWIGKQPRTGEAAQEETWVEAKDAARWNPGFLGYSLISST